MLFTTFNPVTFVTFTASVVCAAYTAYFMAAVCQAQMRSAPAQTTRRQPAPAQAVPADRPSRLFTNV